MAVQQILVTTIIALACLLLIVLAKTQPSSDYDKLQSKTRKSRERFFSEQTRLAHAQQLDIRQAETEQHQTLTQTTELRTVIHALLDQFESERSRSIEIVLRTEESANHIDVAAANPPSERSSRRRIRVTIQREHE